MTGQLTIEKYDQPVNDGTIWPADWMTDGLTIEKYDWRINDRKI